MFVAWLMSIVYIKREQHIVILFVHEMCDLGCSFWFFSLSWLLDGGIFILYKVILMMKNKKITHLPIHTNTLIYLKVASFQNIMHTTSCTKLQKHSKNNCLLCSLKFDRGDSSHVRLFFIRELEIF